MKACFFDLKVLRAPEHVTVKPRAPARVRCSRSELEKVFSLWDHGKSFLIIPASESELMYRCGLYAVSKDLFHHRQILNPVPEKSRSWTVNDSTKRLAHASLLCSAWLRPDERWVISGVSQLHRLGAPCTKEPYTWVFQEIKF